MIHEFSALLLGRRHKVGAIAEREELLARLGDADKNDGNEDGQSCNGHDNHNGEELLVGEAWGVKDNSY